MDAVNIVTKNYKMNRKTKQQITNNIPKAGNRNEFLLKFAFNYFNVNSPTLKFDQV
jgi:hypothetical protein